MSSSTPSVHITPLFPIIWPSGKELWGDGCMGEALGELDCRLRPVNDFQVFFHLLST